MLFCDAWFKHKPSTNLIFFSQFLRIILLCSWNSCLSTKDSGTKSLNLSSSEHIYFFGRKMLFNFVEVAFRHWSFPVNLLHIFRKTFYKDTYGEQLLPLSFCSHFKVTWQTFGSSCPVLLPEGKRMPKIINENTNLVCSLLFRLCSK